MKIRRILPLGVAALVLAAMPFTARADQQGAAAPQKSASGSAVPGWDELIESLRTLPDRMLAKMPERLRDDPQIRQEVGRVALEALASQTLESIGGDGDAPEFLPSIGRILNVGQPNADTIYRSARLTPGGTYRIRGKQGTVNQEVIAQIVPGAPVRAHLDMKTLKVDAEGRYDVLLSETRPAGHQGDWWKLEPGANRLMLRLVSSDWDKEIEPTLAIERIDVPIGKPRTPAAELEQRLRALPGSIDFMALMFMGHVEEFRDEGYVNRFKIYDVGFGSLQGQFYYNAYYDLADDEALIIESEIPGTCPYRSLILTNETYETTDWANNHSSLNGSQAAPDSDGKLRIVVSARDPGVKNWLDTAGYPNGIIQGRWTGCDSQPVPAATKVKLADVRKHLPGDVATVTPEERQEILRERRRALLERSYW